MSTAAEWDDFKILLGLSRTGSVVGAARELKLDSSTVSRRLTALENALTTPLVLRRGREFGWTPEGRAALMAAAQMEQAASAAKLACHSAKLDTAGVVRLACPPALIHPLVRRLSPMLATREPALQVELNGGYERMDLARGEADIAVRMSRPKERDLIAKHACELGWSVYCARQLSKGPERFKAGVDLHLVLYVESMHEVEPLRWLERHRQATTPITRVDNVEAVNALVASGVGFGVLPCFVGDADARLARALPSPVTRNNAFVVSHQAVRENARVRAVTEALLELFANDESYFRG